MSMYTIKTPEGVFEAKDDNEALVFIRLRDLVSYDIDNEPIIAMTRVIGEMYSESFEYTNLNDLTTAGAMFLGDLPMDISELKDLIHDRYYEVRYRDNYRFKQSELMMTVIFNEFLELNEKADEPINITLIVELANITFEIYWTYETEFIKSRLLKLSKIAYKNVHMIYESFGMTTFIAKTAVEYSQEERITMRLSWLIT